MKLRPNMSDKACPLGWSRAPEANCHFGRSLAQIHEDMLAVDPGGK